MFNRSILFKKYNVPLFTRGKLCVLYTLIYYQCYYSSLYQCLVKLKLKTNNSYTECKICIEILCSRVQLRELLIYLYQVLNRLLYINGNIFCFEHLQNVTLQHTNLLIFFSYFQRWSWKNRDLYRFRRPLPGGTEHR